MANHAPHIAACTMNAATNQSQSLERADLVLAMMLFRLLLAQQSGLWSEEIDGSR